MSDILIDLHERMTSMDDLEFCHMNILYARIADVVTSGNRADMQALAETVDKLFDKSISISPTGIWDAIIGQRDDDGRKTCITSYVLGQISAVQFVVHTILRQMVSDNFVPIIQKDNLGVVYTLLQGGASAKMLSKITFTGEQQIKDALGILLQERIIDFRSNGKENIYFLTPAAKQVASENTPKKR